MGEVSRSEDALCGAATHADAADELKYAVREELLDGQDAATRGQDQGTRSERASLAKQHAPHASERLLAALRGLLELDGVARRHGGLTERDAAEQRGEELVAQSLVAARQGNELVREREGLTVVQLKVAKAVGLGAWAVGLEAADNDAQAGGWEGRKHGQCAGPEHQLERSGRTQELAECRDWPSCAVRVCDRGRAERASEREEGERDARAAEGRASPPSHGRLRGRGQLAVRQSSGVTSATGNRRRECTTGACEAK